jgi:polar amino acid transport system ATP-binding protein/sulfate transport system ATP-binding protein/NitT/TauT family transport system ATP-binding protein
MIQHTKKETLLKANNVHLEYEGKKILRDVNFEIKNITRPDCLQGQVISLIGRSGIGKTQLFRILSGMNKPTSGHIHVNAEQRLVEPGDMGIVPQNYYLFEWRKIQKILEMAVAKNPHVDAKDRKDIIKQYVNDFGLSECLDKYPMQLSGGQRQRVSLIQQLINGSNFILLDEPFSGLDVISIRQVTEVLVKVSLSSETKTLIIVSHDLSNSLAISDCAYILAREGNKEGATITASIDLIERDLAWYPDIKRTVEFQKTVAEIEKLI